MRRSCLIVAGRLTLLTAGPAVAQDFKPPADLFAQQKTPAPKPPPEDWNWRPSANGTPASKTTVVCGMTLVPANPKIDPGTTRTGSERVHQWRRFRH